ncbi:MAG TPA: SIMPL domain-containing protein, partial [Solirubrobacterales bacterium]|nr:SIMPL domain-containing protein [Solirubrobacterales bacterium]
MPSIRKSTLALSLAALLAACALLPAAAGAATGRTVAVTASANIKVPNDTATVGFGVKRERKTRAAALQATAAGLDKVIATAKTFPGVGDGDIRTGRVHINPVKKGKVTVYRATEGIQVTLHEPAKSGELIAKGLAAGATGVQGPSFSVGNEEEAFAKVLAAAFVKAKERAGVLAAQAGAHLGQALTIEEGSGAEFIGPRSFEAAEEEGGSAGVAKAAPPPTKPGTSQVKATVHVIFELS